MHLLIWAPILILWCKNCYLHFIGENTEVSMVLFIVSGIVMLQIQSCSPLKSVLFTPTFTLMKKLRGVVIYEKYLLSAFPPLFLLSSSQIMFMWCVINVIEEIKHLLLHSVTIYLLRSNIIIYQFPSFILYSDKDLQPCVPKTIC